MSGLLGRKNVVQIAFVVENIEDACRNFSRLLGTEAGPITDAGDYCVIRTVLDGAPAPDTNCRMAFLQAGNGVTIELIQPNGAPSVWQEHLEQKGPGFHHIAFCVDDMDAAIAQYGKAGFPLRQQGRYRDDSGAYAYLDARDTLHMYIELLTQDRKEQEHAF